MDKGSFEQTISVIVDAIKEAGYDPYVQLGGYLKTGQDYYITRTKNARALIKQIEKDELQRYLDEGYIK